MCKAHKQELSDRLSWLGERINLFMTLVDMYNKHIVFHCHFMQKSFQETETLLLIFMGRST
jgi:hypothetical protein